MVVEPWLAHIERYKEKLERIDDAWASKIAPASREATSTNPQDPSAILLTSLLFADPRRELRLVIPELLARLSKLRRITEDISDDIANIGTLIAFGTFVAGAGAFIPASLAASTVGLYYSGFSIARGASDLWSRASEALPRRFKGWPCEANDTLKDYRSLAELAAKGNYRVRWFAVSPELSPAETSAALRLWLRSLSNASRSPFHEAKITSDATEVDVQDSDLVQFFGGPLVRAPHPHQWKFAWDVEQSGDRWYLRQGQALGVTGDSSESLGFVSAGLRNQPPMILTCGFRDTGGVRAIRALERVLRCDYSEQPTDVPGLLVGDA